MKIENQNTEHKESWRDEYLKWICGSANTFFRAGEIEAWGRGIERIINGCEQERFSTVDFRYDACGLWTTFKYQYPERAEVSANTQDHTKDHTKETIQLIAHQAEIIKYLVVP